MNVHAVVSRIPLVFDAVLEEQFSNFSQTDPRLHGRDALRFCHRSLLRWNDRSTYEVSHTHTHARARQVSGRLSTLGNLS